MSYTKGSDFAPHNMTSNTTPSPYVVIKSTEYSMLPAFHAFDGVIGSGFSYWVTDGFSAGYIGIDLGSGNSKKCYSYKYYVNTVPEPNRAPKNWTFEGSNNGVDWTVLDTQTGQTAWGSGEGREFTLSQSMMGTAYRYFRVNVTLNNGDAYL